MYRVTVVYHDGSCEGRAFATYAEAESYREFCYRTCDDYLYITLSRNP